MMSSLIEMMVYTIVALLAVKMVFFRKDQSKAKNEQTESVSWKSAVESMAIMETRLNQLQERDLKQQERIWTLEDMNRDLQNRLGRATKELLLMRPCGTGPTPLDDDDEDDINHSIPTR